MAKSDLDSLEAAMNYEPKPQKSAAELDLDVLEQISSGASFKGRGAGTGTVNPKAAASEAKETETNSVTVVANDAEYVTVQGIQYEVGKIITLSPDLITKVFGGNKRNRDRLRNIGDLADKIIEAGRNTEAVALRALPDSTGFELIKGNRRTEAYRLATTMTDKPLEYRAYITKADDREAVIDAAMENLSREEMDPWEHADTLQGLLDDGVVGRIEDLKPFLPDGKKNIHRAGVYQYLNPAKVPNEVRRYIDESLPVPLSKIGALKQLLDNKLPISVQELGERMKDRFKLARHSVQEVTGFIELEVLNKQQVEREIQREISITGAHGTSKISYKVSPTGKFRGDFGKDLSPEKVATALEIGLKSLREKEG